MPTALRSPDAKVRPFLPSASNTWIVVRRASGSTQTLHDEPIDT